MYSLEFSSGFHKDFKRYEKKRYDFRTFEICVTLLQEEGKLPPQFSPHSLKGKWKGCFECHLAPDWLLVWEQDEKQKLITLIALGTHDELFKNKKR